MQLIWVPVAQGLLGGWRSAVSGAVISSEGLTRGRSASESFMKLLAGFSSLQYLGPNLSFFWAVGPRCPSVLCHVGLFAGQLTTWQPAFHRADR